MAKNCENFELLVKIFPRDKSPWAIFTKLSTGRVSRVRTLRPNFTIVTLKMWAYNPQNRWNWQFLVYICPKGVYPLSNFYKIWLGGGSPRFVPSFQISSLWVKNVGVQCPKSPKLVFFGINLPKRGIPPWANFTKFGWGTVSQVRTLTPNFTVLV